MTDARPYVPAILLSVICITAILWHYHDQFWWPADEGVYAYVAQRANAGDVLHRDLIDLHSGYGNLINAWAFRAFGEDLLSLRYPLIAITLLQSVIAFVLLKPNGPVTAAIGAIAVTTFSFVQFPNPSASWHALGTFFCLCLCLEKMPVGSAKRLFLAGLLVGICFFTRQLSGVFLGFGLICVLLIEAPRSDENRRLPSLLVGGVPFLALLVYLGSKQDNFGMVWGGVWPLGLLLLVTLRARISWGYAGRTAGLVFAGFALAGLPIILWAASNGALTYWAFDIFFTALMINGQDFISTVSYFNYLSWSWQILTNGIGLIPSASAIAWSFLILSVPLLGALTAANLFRTGAARPTALLAVFWAIAALHYQIPIYLIFVLPAVLFALLLIRPGTALAATLVIVTGWSLMFQVGQPLERGLTGTIISQIHKSNIPSGLPRVSLRVNPDDVKMYHRLIDTIESTARPGEALMTLPMAPEINFMTARKSPTRYYGTPLGLRTPQDLQDTIAALDAAAPLFVINRRMDKYLTPLSAELLEQVVARSPAPIQVGLFDLYRYQPAEEQTSSLDAQ